MEYKFMLTCDESYSEDEEDTAADEECNGCGCIVDSCGYCTDLDCPYGECLQNEEPG